jgi:hypothetical protein
MWRAYYDRRYLDLAKGLYKSSRHVGFSPVTCLVIAFQAGRAALVFQKSRSREEAQSALPYLINYYKTLSAASPSVYAADEAARMELEWWQGRRERVGPEQYGLTIARVASMIYGVWGDEVNRSGVLRAEAMAYRDARRQSMKDSDWMAVQRILLDSYFLLYRAIHKSSL